METLRAFIAVDIGHEVRNRLTDFQHRLAKSRADVRWVKPRGIHLTLAFLGKLPLEKIQPLKRSLDHALQGMHPFEFDVAGTGTFGRPGNPRVVWSGISECRPLKELQCRTAEALRSAGIVFDDKPFSPHLTLGRVKSPAGVDKLLQLLERDKSVFFGHVHIASVELLQSKLQPSGAEYTVLHKSVLG